ncbi:MAG: serine protease [Verrucomicrobiota bacterium]
MRPITKLKYSALLLAALLTGVAGSLSAQEVIEKLEVQGSSETRVYQHVRILGVTDKGVKISHDAGIAVIPFALLPKELADKYPGPSGAAPVADGASMVSGSSLPPSGEDQDSATAEVVKSFDPNCLVFIKTEGAEGEKATGTGFIALVNGKSYVYTNAHVICGGEGHFTKKIVSIKTAGNREITVPYELELSESYDKDAPSGLEDLARFPIHLKAGEKAYEIGDLEAADYVGKSVLAYGDSGGTGVMTTLEGKVIALGTDRMEISCEIVPGNSGGPVVLADSKKVIGVSTYLTAGKRDLWSRNTKFEKIRRFAIRPEMVKKWRKLQYTSLITALDELSGFGRDTLTMAAACLLNPIPNRGGFELPTTVLGDYVLKDIILSGNKYPLGATIVSGIASVNQRLGGGRGTTLAMQFVVPVFQDFFSKVTSKSNSQISSLKTADRAPYLKQYTGLLIEDRLPVHAQFIQEGLTRYR